MTYNKSTYDFVLKDIISSNTGPFYIDELLPGNRCIIEFLNTGTRHNVALSDAFRGSVQDWNVPNHCGIGYLGENHEPTSWTNDLGEKVMNPAFTVWRAMLERCHGKRAEELYPSYKNVTVCKRWLSFANFCEDIKNLENYESWYKDKYNDRLGRDDGWDLDKDTKQQGVKNRVYSPSTCMFLLNKDNKALRYKEARKLTEDQVREIRNSKESTAALRRKFKLAHSNIARIRENRTYKDVE